MQGEKDDKIIAVCADDPEYRHFKDINELPPHRLAEIRRFFEDCKCFHACFFVFYIFPYLVLEFLLSCFVHIFLLWSFLSKFLCGHVLVTD